MSPKFLLTAVICLLLAPIAQAGPKIEHWVSPSGARVYFVESRLLPILDIQVDFTAGSINDPEGKSGLAALTRATLDLGAGKRDETAIAEELADIGASFGGSANTDRASINVRTLSARDKRDVAVDLMRAAIQEPRFEPAIFEREKANAISALKDALTRPDTIANDAFRKALYPDHPYGRKATPESLGAITRDDLSAFHARLYTAKNARITLVGDLSRAEAEQIAETLTSRLPAGEPGFVPPAPKAPPSQRIKLAHPASQAHIQIGTVAIERGNPDFFPLMVGNYTLGGGGFVSRLMKEVRDKRGYAYGVSSHFAPMLQPGPFQIGLQTKRSQAEDAIKLVWEILETFLKEGPTPDELAAAKANLAGGFPLRLDSNKKILESVALIGFFGLPLDYLDHFQARIQAVTADDVRQAFARHVRPDRLVTVTVAAD